MKKYLRIPAFFCLWSIAIYFFLYFIIYLIGLTNTGNRVITFLHANNVIITLITSMILVFLTVLKKWDTNSQLFIIEVILRFYLGSGLLVYGLTKILDYQFKLAYDVWDAPLKDITGRHLVWAFLGHSYAYELFIAIPEFAGSILLFFNHTKFLGKIILLPVILNVVVVNYSFDLWEGTKFISLLFFFSIVILLLFEWKKIKQIVQIVFKVIHPFNFSIRKTKLMLFATIGFAAILLFLNYCTLNSSEMQHLANPPLAGDWRIVSYKKNGVELLSSCDTINHDARLFLSFGFHSVLKLRTTANAGLYTVDKKKTLIEISFNDTMIKPISARYKLSKDTLLTIYGQQNKDSIRLACIKQQYNFKTEGVRF